MQRPSFEILYRLQMALDKALSFYSPSACCKQKRRLVIGRTNLVLLNCILLVDAHSLK